jgi:hypothetical protein
MTNSVTAILDVKHFESFDGEGEDVIWRVTVLLGCKEEEVREVDCEGLT